MIKEPVIKTCLTCGKTLQGRADKKFCTDYCRNAFNNQLNSNENRYMRAINQHLRKNRRILEGILAPGQRLTKISKKYLLDTGFLFGYFTHTYTNRNGKLFYCCYEYGYFRMEKEVILIVKLKNPSEQSKRWHAEARLSINH